MATKKKGKTAKKTSAKKTSAKKTSAKKTSAKKIKVPYAPNADRIVYFMNSLIQAGFVGKTIPEESKGKKVAALSIRQMAQQLDRQVHRTVT